MRFGPRQTRPLKAACWMRWIAAWPFFSTERPLSVSLSTISSRERGPVLSRMVRISFRPLANLSSVSPSSACLPLLLAMNTGPSSETSQRTSSVFTRWRVPRTVQVRVSLRWAMAFSMSSGFSWRIRARRDSIMAGESWAFTPHTDLIVSAKELRSPRK